MLCSPVHNQIGILLANIYNGLATDPSPSFSLMGGRGGAALFKFLYLRHTGSETLIPVLEKDIGAIAENLPLSNNPTFCNGQAGAYWLFKFLAANDILSQTDCDFLCEEEATLNATALRMLDAGNYDFLHGAVGIAYQQLYGPSTPDNDFHRRFLNGLQRLRSTSTDGRMIPHYNVKDRVVEPDKINMGLSHGLPSILKYCLACYRSCACPDLAVTLARDIISYIVENTNKDTRYCYFPSIVSPDDTARKSRLGWCYGDLGVAWILYQAGCLLDDQPTVRLSMEVLRHAAGRRDPEHTLVGDTGLCHGSAGIALIFDRLGRLTGEPVFKNACDHWIDATLTMNSPKAAGLLEGSAGPGLALLSHITGNFDWDYCLMLNN